MAQPSSTQKMLGFGTVPVSGIQKSEQVSKLMKSLEDNLAEPKVDLNEQRAILEQLKVFGRDPRNATPIYSKSGISTLAKYALDHDASPTSGEALRCIANALLLDPKLRQTFVDLGYPSKAAKRLQTSDIDEEFLLCRIIFLLTYETKYDFEDLFDNYALGASINKFLLKHTERAAKNVNDYTPSSKETAALSETLKLLFNLTNFYPKRTNEFAPSIDCIFKLLNSIPISQPPLQVPINYLINTLVNLAVKVEDDKETTANSKAFFPEHEPNCNIDKLIDILDHCIKAYKSAELDTLAAPLVAVLRKIYELGSEENQKHMQSLLLPSDQDRDLPIGQSESLSSRLLQLSTSAMAPNMREAISSMMFELSGEDPTRFVQNLGYGYAAGYLMSREIAIPDAVSEGYNVNDGSKDGRSVPVNPITGQRLDKEPVGEMPEMTMEEKELEAERLFVLFERLRGTGVINVENPVRQAMEQGRLDNRVQEVDSDSD